MAAVRYLALTALVLAAGPTGAANVLLVTENSGSLTSQESLRKAQFEAWGHTVTTLWDGDSQANFDTATASVDLVYVSEEALSTDLGYKLRTTTVGVVSEERLWDNEMGFATSNGTDWTSSSITLTDNTHAITSGLTLGTLTLTSSSQTLVYTQGTVASGATILAELSGDADLFVLETGATLANTYSGNSTASGRRVRLPWGGDAFDWSSLNATGLQITSNAIDWAVGPAASNGLTVLFVIDGSTPDADESARIATFQGWGYTVATIQDSDSQANYDTALASADVAYVPETIASTAVDRKLREATIGVVVEEHGVHDEMGFSTTAGFARSGTGITITDNSHDITSGFSLGSVTLTTTTQSLSRTNPTVATGIQALAEASGNYDLFVLEEGAQLADTYNGSNIAFGRRVGLPISNGFDWSSLTSDGQTLVRRALEWASGGDLIGHWKLDELSGTTAVDSGPGGLDGTYENGVALDQGGPYPGVTAPEFDGSNDHVELPTINARFQSGLTIAAWVKPDATLASGQYHEILDLSNGLEVDQILLSYNGAAGLQLFLTDTVDGSALRTIEDNTGFTAGRWVHCVATIDSSGYGKIYRNGKVTKSGFFTSFPASVARSTATIGKSAFGDHFGGGLQDVRLYNYELSAEEIAELYGLVGHWEFDEGTGTTIADSSGGGNDAAFDTGSPTWVDGVHGSAVEFDGSSDATTDDVFDPPAVASLAFWFRCNAAPTTTERLLGLGNDWEVHTGSSGRIAVNLTNGSTGSFKTDDGVAQADRWRHLVASYDTVTGATQLHLDGVLVSSDTRGLTAQSAAVLAFGTRNGSTQRFNGALDDVRVYNRWLSAPEIAELYGLVGWWRMEETSGTAVADSSGAGNHGTLNTTATWSANAKEGSGSLELDGTNHVEIPGLILTEGSGSLAGWARLTDNDAYGSELISLGNHFGIRIDSTRSGQGSYGYTYNGSSWNDVKPNVYHEGSGWRHFALVANDDKLTRDFYIDGVLQETITASGPLVMSGQDSSTLIGSKGSNYDFTGQLDDVRVYNRPLLPGEVRTLYYGEFVTGPRIVKWVEVASP